MKTLRHSAVLIAVLATALLQTSSSLRPAGGALAARSAAATRSLKATFVDDDNWGTGYVGEYQITNLGPEEVPGWQLSFSLPAGSGLVKFLERGGVGLRGRGIGDQRFEGSRR